MSPTNITAQARAYPARCDLRRELNQIWKENFKQFCDESGNTFWGWSPDHITVTYPSYVLHDPPCFMLRSIFDELVEHEKRFGKLSGIADEDRELSAANVLRDGAWPACESCHLPFVTMFNGHQGFGAWVCRIEHGDALCEACWLTERYGGDHEKMIEHVLRVDMVTPVIRQSIAVDLRRHAPRMGDRGWGAWEVIYSHSRTWWHSPGLRELLRLHRVSLTTAAGVIVRMISEMVADRKSKEKEIAHRRAATRQAWESAHRAAWIEEQRDPNALANARPAAIGGVRY